MFLYSVLDWLIHFSLEITENLVHIIIIIIIIINYFCCCNHIMRYCLCLDSYSFFFFFRWVASFGNGWYHDFKYTHAHLQVIACALLHIQHMRIRVHHTADMSLITGKKWFEMTSQESILLFSSKQAPGEINMELVTRHEKVKSYKDTQRNAHTNTYLDIVLKFDRSPSFRQV